MKVKINKKQVINSTIQSMYETISDDMEIFITYYNTGKMFRCMVDVYTGFETGTIKHIACQYEDKTKKDIEDFIGFVLESPDMYQNFANYNEPLVSRYYYSVDENIEANIIKYAVNNNLYRSIVTLRQRIDGEVKYGHFYSDSMQEERLNAEINGIVGNPNFCQQLVENRVSFSFG